MSSLFSFSIFQIHLLACPCGSIERGHLLAFFIIMAFSTEKLSEGRPDMFQALILTGSPRTVMSENSFSPDGICFSLHRAFHSFMRSCLNFYVNAPR